MSDTGQHDLVMTAFKNGSESTIRIDRLEHSKIDLSEAHHVGEGPYKGIIINRAAKTLQDVEKPDKKLRMLVTMTDTQNGKEVTFKEIRELRFWLKNTDDVTDKGSKSVQEYFDALLKPDAFPKDYINFIKKSIVLAQHFPTVKRIEINLRPEVIQEEDKEIIQDIITPNLVVATESAPPEITPIQVIPVEATPDENGIPPDQYDHTDESNWENYGDNFRNLHSGGAARRGDEKSIHMLEDDIIPEDEECDEDRIENYITVMTPAIYDYQYLPEVPVTDKAHINFTLKATSDGCIALSSIYGDTERKTYEVIIGSAKNHKSIIRYGGQGEIVAEAKTINILNAEESSPFWVSWDRGMIQVGQGHTRGYDVFLRWNIPENRTHPINCLAVSTGHGSKGEWEFVEILKPQKEEDASKAARRARFRISLLWIAKKQKMLQVLEDAYPNSVDTPTLISACKIKLHDMMTAVVFLKEMQKKGLIKEVSAGIWLRSPSSAQDVSHNVQMVDEIPMLTGKESPTIAVVTSIYCEKLAVDAMMENKTSYVKYKTEGNGLKGFGESQVYTIGRIGLHQVVSTKLSKTGNSQASSIAGGNTITRLMGIFSKIQHVFLVGCGGSVPHYSDYEKHIRLGDIVVSAPQNNNDAQYIYCDKFEKIDDKNFNYNIKTWRSVDDVLLNQVQTMRDIDHRRAFGMRSWERYIEEGNQAVKAQESNFHRPNIKKDKLYAIINDEEVQVEHPKPPQPYDEDDDEHRPRVRFGTIACGKYVARNDRIRMEFGRKYRILAYDAEFNNILESLEGNGNQSFLIIRGISDYVDGVKNKEWQPYAALNAAGYMKAVITSLPSIYRA